MKKYLKKKILRKIKNFFKNKINLILSIVIVILTITMLFYETQKEGFNEDEIFSYGSSNYKYDNLYQPYGVADVYNTVLFKYILQGNWFANIVFCLNNNNVYYYLCDTEYNIDPIWKTREEATGYLTIQPSDIFDFAPVIWNQSRDVHPPLFYLLVHIVSSFFLGAFSKYIVFSINIIFYILTCIYIYKIFKLYKKEKAGIIAVILYGLSIGAISTVMLQRMYMMMTFFVLLYTYICLKISRKGMQKREITELSICTILGFLTQYYFCLFALIMFLILFIHLKGKRKTWIWENIKLAILGVAIFPASIYHIFFSYRGITSLQENYFERLRYYIEKMFREFSLNNAIRIYVFFYNNNIINSIFYTKKKRQKDFRVCNTYYSSYNILLNNFKNCTIFRTKIYFTNTSINSYRNSTLNIIFHRKSKQKENKKSHKYNSYSSGC